MKALMNRFLPEELIRALQAAYWIARFYRLVQEI